ncbi:MAG: sigma factor-like helix-turn-helix DNA-binding protein [Oscillospiraceae bacterium]
MKNQAYRMALLFDFYGEVLTDRQKEFYDLYYNEDLSLAEIAENYDISRQGVRDAIVRGEEILTELEEKTGLIRRFKENQALLHKIELQVDEVIKYTHNVNGFDGVSAILEQIKHDVSTLYKE